MQIQPIAPEQIVTFMLQHDLYSQWLGISLITCKVGYCKIKMTVRPEMINGLGIIHGGIAFSFADSAFAFACNNRNRLSVALDTSINFIKPIQVGQTLIAESKELHHGKSTGLYEVYITSECGQLLALFKGTCFITEKTLV